MGQRRWFHRLLRLQFGLRSLLIAVVAVAGWCAWYLQPQQRETILAGGAMLLFEQYRLVTSDDGERHEVQHGRWEVRDHQRRLHVRGRYRDNAASGRWTYYHANGKKAATGLARFGHPDGVWRTWYATGQLETDTTFAQVTLTGLEDRIPRGTDDDTWSSGPRMIHNVVSYPQGPVRTWHANGKLACVGEYTEGERSGVWSHYDEQGRKTSEGAYRRDRRDGRWTFWDQPGQPPRVAGYVAGQVVEDVESELAACESDLLQGDLGQKLLAARRLERFGPRGVAVLTRAARHEDARVRLLAARTLGTLGEDAASATDMLESLTADSQDDVRQQALLALVRVDKPRRTTWVRTILAGALPRRGDRHLRDVSEAVAEDVHPDDAEHSAVTKVARLGQVIVPALHELLDSPHVEIRLLVLDVLRNAWEIADASREAILEKAKQDPSDSVRQYASELTRSAMGGGFF